MEVIGGSTTQWLGVSQRRTLADSSDKGALIGHLLLSKGPVVCEAIPLLCVKAGNLLADTLGTALAQLGNLPEDIFIAATTLRSVRIRAARADGNFSREPNPRRGG